MLSNEIWNALAKNGKKEYEPMLGRRYKDARSGFVGKADYYTLSGQLRLNNGTETRMAWAIDCKPII